MLPKINRADKKTIEKIFKDGRFLNSLNLTFKFIKTNEKERVISFIVPKSVAKLAVKRNSLRRRGYLAVQKELELFPLGIKGVFIFKNKEENIIKLNDEIKGIINKIN